jgi:hypothetical protein
MPVLSLSFPLSLTKVAKLPHSHINILADKFLDAEIHRQVVNPGDEISTRQTTRQTYRLVIRLLAEMQLSGIVALGRLVDQDYLMGNALVALLSETARNMPQALALGSGHVGRPITIRAMARSFNRPYETMRRALHRLYELEWVDLGEDGVTLRPGATSRPEIQAYLLEIHDITVTLLEDLFIFAKLPTPAFAREGCTPEAIQLAALDLHLLAVEGMQSIFTDWTGLLLSAAIAAGNVREITYHPELAFTYASADQIPPLNIRKPVQFKALCDALPVCPTTAWRRISAMKLVGTLKSLDGGFILDAKWLKNPTIITNGCERVERMHAILKKLAYGDSSLEDIRSLYLQGRVAPIAVQPGA